MSHYSSSHWFCWNLCFNFMLIVYAMWLALWRKRMWYSLLNYTSKMCQTLEPSALVQCIGRGHLTLHSCICKHILREKFGWMSGEHYKRLELDKSLSSLPAQRVTEWNRGAQPCLLRSKADRSSSVCILFTNSSERYIEVFFTLSLSPFF